MNTAPSRRMTVMTRLLFQRSLPVWHARFPCLSSPDNGSKKKRRMSTRSMKNPPGKPKKGAGKKKGKGKEKGKE